MRWYFFNQLVGKRRQWRGATRMMDVIAGPFCQCYILDSKAVRKMHEVYFFSMNESYADQHYDRVRKLCPRIQLIQNIAPALKAWKRAAQNCESSHFLSIDSDCFVSKSFDFDRAYCADDDRRVHVWRSKNAVNGLVYGHGAIKLWPKCLFLDSEYAPETCDLTSGIAKHGHFIQIEVASENRFNTSEFDSFRAAFKECFKLYLNQTVYYGTQRDPNTDHRIKIWCSLGADTKFGQFAILGARMGVLVASQSQGLSVEQLQSKYSTRNVRLKFDKTESIEKELEKTLPKIKKLGIDAENLTVEKSSEIKKWIYPN